MLRRLCITLSIATLLLGSAQAAQDRRGDYVINYGFFENRPVALVLDQDHGQVYLRVQLNGRALGDRQTLEFMARQVEKLVSTGPQEFPLGLSGVNVTFTGGHPKWGPFIQYLDSGNHYLCLQFADGWRVGDKLIVLQGDPSEAAYHRYNVH